MKLKPLGKIIVLLLVLSLSIGGWRLWKRFGGESASAANSRSVAQAANSNSSAADNEIQLVASDLNRGWLKAQITKFNTSQNDFKISPTPIPVREAMHALLNGQTQPALWCPSSVGMANRFEEVWYQKTGQTIFDTRDASQFRIIVRTPVVFLTTRKKAAFLRPLLSTGDGWSNLRDLSIGKKRVPWGELKWTQPSPLIANAGILTIALILADYTEKHGDRESAEQVAKSPRFATYLRELTRRFRYEKALAKHSKLVEAYAKDPSRFDFVIVYENAALNEAKKNPDLAVIYPNPTADAENSVAILHANWVSPHQREGAAAFLKFITGPEAAKEAIKASFRPVYGGNFASEFPKYTEQGFKQTYPVIELPPYQAINSAIYVWSQTIRSK